MRSVPHVPQDFDPFQIGLRRNIITSLTRHTFFAHGSSIELMAEQQHELMSIDIYYIE